MAFPLIGALLNMFGGGVVGKVADALQDAHQASLNAKNDAERVASEERREALQARKDVLVAEARTNWNIAFRGFLAVPFGLFVWKVVVWDKILGAGATDNLSPDLWNLLMIVYGFYFVYETASLFKRT